MIISSTRIMRPGILAQPEYLLASIYLLSTFITHNKDFHPAIMNIIQYYIKIVGIKMVDLI